MLSLFLMRKHTSMLPIQVCSVHMQTPDDFLNIFITLIINRAINVYYVTLTRIECSIQNPVYDFLCLIFQ